MGLNLEFEMSVLSDLGGRWDVFFLPEVIDLILYLQIGMFDPAAAAVATYLRRVLYSDLGGRSCIFLPGGHSPNLIGSAKGLLRVLRNFH